MEAREERDNFVMSMLRVCDFVWEKEKQKKEERENKTDVGVFK